MTEIESDFLAWETAIQSYVMQLTQIENVYDIIDKLGMGSFGYVVLGKLKSIKSPASKLQGSDHVNISALNQEEMKEGPLL